ncbi:SWIM zinc finger family protein [Halorientalis regularis]|uniref:SWIM zinc finger n=1 Tax=Halorientalis regularis TaxID=660518 RepID=A0A1G7UAG4_9EURY|nr:SWIM zinc finger family protein [Halorientalis regularis]SDG44473.1 SWIM zinc finger [Halorientalis regularis]
MAVAPTSTPATTRRSVAAATEYIATCRVAPQLYEVVNDSGDTYVVDLREPACTCPDYEYRADSDDRVGEHGCKHIRRVRMERGEIDIAPLRETNLRLDPLLLEAIADV